jgi:hypothetical protein
LAVLVSRPLTEWIFKSLTDILDFSRREARRRQRRHTYFHRFPCRPLHGSAVRNSAPRVNFCSQYVYEKLIFSLTDKTIVTGCWLFLLAATGVYNITTFPGIFRAYDPSRAVLCMYSTLMKVCSVSHWLPADFVRTKNYDTLAGVLLAITGCEALFAKYDTFTPPILYPLVVL